MFAVAPTTSRTNSTNATSATMTTNVSNTVPPITIALTARASMTTAEARRTGRSAFLRGAVSTSAIAPLPPRKFRKRIGQVLGGEIGPQHIGEDHFRICALPQQEVREPQFPARADKQVERREVAAVAMPFN